MTTYSKPQIEEISQNVHLLTFNKKKLYLVGTAHVSTQSVELVEKTINEVNPDTVCIELDEQRYKNMTRKNFEDIDLFEIIKKKQIFFYIGQFIMASYQKKIAEKTGTKPGDEFKKAIELAKEKNLKLVLADRNVGTTLKRAWRLTPLKHKFKFLGGLLASDSEEIEKIDIEELKKKDAIDTIVKMFADELPITKEVLIDERDTYLTHEIQKSLGEITVAVVGAGHVPGMLEKFKELIPESKKEEINFIPPTGTTGKIIPWLIPAIVVCMFIWGFMYGRKEIAQEAIIFWVLANGILTLIGCALAMAHPLTMIAGFIAAPITSLNPTIGAGFVTSLVQTFISKPRVKDFEEIHNQSLKFKQWWSNRVTKIFLVFILSSLGSSIGTFVALPVLTKLFS